MESTFKHFFPLTIPRRSSSCYEGKELLTPGMEYYSIIQEDGSSGQLIRKDYCAGCWSKMGSTHKGEHPFWKGRISDKKENSQPPLDRNEKALELLKSALSEEGPESQVEAFVLAVFLARNKKLALRQELAKGAHDVYFLYEVLATEEILAVKKMDLPQLLVEKIQQTIAKKFQS